MENKSLRRFRPSFEQLETREVPAFLTPVLSDGGGDMVSLGDANHDGFADVAAIEGTNVRISLGLGDGTFAQADILNGASGQLYVVTFFDFNGDGDLDVVAGGASRLGGPGCPLRHCSESVTHYLNVWFGDGNGAFGDVFSRTEFRAPVWPVPVASDDTVTADFNNDGFNDYATLWPTYDAITLVLRNSDGSDQARITYTLDRHTVSIASGDINGDGWRDLCVTFKGGQLSVLLNDGNW